MTQLYGDHPDRLDMIASGEFPDPAKATAAEWLEWADANYPYDAASRRRLLTRTRRPVPGSRAELEDLRGQRDRTQAAFLAQLWFHLGTRSYEQAMRDKAQHEAWLAAERERKRAAQEAQESEQSPRRQFKRGRAQAWQE